MTTRTVQFIGKAYSATSTLDVALWVNNVELFNGTVAASTDPVPSILLRQDAEVVFTFDLSTDIVGTVPLMVTIEGGGPLAFYHLNSNYTGLNRSPADPTVITQSPVDFYSDLCIRSTEHDGRYEVEMNGIPKTRWNEDEIEGQVLPDWNWWIPADGYMSCKIDIAPPVIDIPPAFTSWDESTAYPIKSLIRIGTIGYQALKAVPAGTPLTNTEFWQSASDSF